MASKKKSAQVNTAVEYVPSRIMPSDCDKLPNPINKKIDRITFGKLIKSQFISEDKLSFIDNKSAMKSTDISSQTNKILSEIFSEAPDDKNKLQFQINTTSMFIYAAHTKFVNLKQKNPHISVKDDTYEHKYQIYKAKKFMEYSFNKVFDFIKINTDYLSKFTGNILLIDIENIINRFRDYLTNKYKIPFENFDREIIVNIILDYIYYIYGNTILPIFCINNIGRITETIVLQKRNTKDDKSIDYIRVVANINQGELDDYLLAQFCILLDMGFTNRFNYFVFTFDNMEWWFYKPQKLCFVYLENNILTKKGKVKGNRKK